jgi:hypothetical protein
MYRETPFAPPIRLRCLPPAMNPVKSYPAAARGTIRSADLQDVGDLARAVHRDLDAAAFE